MPSLPGMTANNTLHELSVNQLNHRREWCRYGPTINSVFNPIQAWSNERASVIPLGKYKQTVKKLLGNSIYHTYLPLLRTFSFIAKNDDEMLVQSKCIACFLFEGICLPNISYRDENWTPGDFIADFFAAGACLFASELYTPCLNLNVHWMEGRKKDEMEKQSR